MNARETSNAIQSGNQQDAQRAMFQLLAMVQELATATLEMAHTVEEFTGHDPIGQRPRQWLSEFLDLPRRKEKEMTHNRHDLDEPKDGKILGGS